MIKQIQPEILSRLRELLEKYKQDKWYVEDDECGCTHSRLEDQFNRNICDNTDIIELILSFKTLGLDILNLIDSQNKEITKLQNDLTSYYGEDERAYIAKIKLLKNELKDAIVDKNNLGHIRYNLACKLGKSDGKIGNLEFEILNLGKEVEKWKSLTTAWSLC